MKIAEDIDKEMRLKYKAAKEALLLYPNVLGVGIGLKEVKNRITDKLAWRVYVNKKILPHFLSAIDRVPHLCSGIETDVIEYNTTQPSCDNGYRQILSPGIQIANERNGEGTLGCFARLRSEPSSIVILSNNHVLYYGNVSADGRIGQPSITCSGCKKCGIIANNIGNGNNGWGNTTSQIINGQNYIVGNIDCGVSRLVTNVRSFTNNIPSIGMISGTPPVGQMGIAITSPPNLSNPNPDSIVRKVGIATGFTLGQVVMLSYPDPIYDTELTNRAFINQILIMPRGQSVSDFNRKLDFADAGDSGAVVVNRNNQVIGLLRGTTTFTPAQLSSFGLPATLGNFGVVSPIHPVLDALQIDIPANFHSSGTTAGSPVFITNSKEPTEVNELIHSGYLFRQFIQSLSQSRAGKKFALSINQHKAEIDRLITSSRKVMITWNRHYGPAWVAHLMNGLRDPEYILPNQIKGVSRLELLKKITESLKESGSIGLVEDITLFYPILERALKEVGSTEDFIKIISLE